jgi:hypothetical protein
MLSVYMALIPTLELQKDYATKELFRFKQFEN